MWQFTAGKHFSLGNFLFGVVELTKNVNFDRYKYSAFGIGFDACRSFPLSDSSEFGQNVIMFGPYVSSSVHNKKITNKKIKKYLDSW